MTDTGWSESTKERSGCVLCVGEGKSDRDDFFNFLDFFIFHFSVRRSLFEAEDGSLVVGIFIGTL